MRAGNTGILTFDDCEVPAANRVGEEGEGFTIAMSAIDQGRYTVAAGSVGLAQACLDASVKYAHERKAFGSEIGEHQLVKQMIAKMYAGIEAGRLLVWKAGWKKNRGERNTRETGLAKWFATDHAVASALDAIQIHGAYGYSNEYPVERYLRNSQGLGHLRGNLADPHPDAGRLPARLPQGSRPADAAARLRRRDVALADRSRTRASSAMTAAGAIRKSRAVCGAE